MQLNKNKLPFQIISFLFPLIIFIITLAPSVTFIDAGELSTACTSLGICHPTGYPLFTIIGRLFSLLPTGSHVYSLNLMCAVISSSAVFMFFNLMVFLIARFEMLKVVVKNTVQNDMLTYTIALAAALMLAFSRTFWGAANAIEVYSLHSFFLITNIFLFLKAIDLTEREDKYAVENRERYWLLFAFVLGMSFANHLSTIFLSVGFLYLFFAVCGLNKLTFRRILILVIPFIIGLSLYVYLPVRTGGGYMSWGEPDTLSNIYRHVSGKQFSIWMFTSTDNAAKQFSYFTKNYPIEYFYFPLLISILGLLEIFNRNKRIFYFTVILFVFCVLYAINYDIYDIDSYFLLAYIVTAIWIGFGFIFLAERVKSLQKIPAAFLFVVLAILPLSQNYVFNNESKNYYVKDYTLNMFATAPLNSIIVSHQWDFCVSASLYFQYIENIRRDLAIIDKELLRKSWYIPYLQHHYPEMYKRSEGEFTVYYNELLKFEKYTDRYTTPKNDADKQEILKIQKAFSDLLTSIVVKNTDRNFYVTYEVEQEKQERFAGDYNRVPEGLLIKYTKDKGYDNFQMPDYKFDINHDPQYHISFLMNAYYNSYVNRANYLMNFSKLDEAETLLNIASNVDPRGPEVGQLRNKIKQLRTQQSEIQTK
ncbi:hypothetical protein BH10BAC5_BH10BAC5_00580 [soil metagenome]